MSTANSFSFVIIGGGILGSALAALAVGAGLDPLVLRLSDRIVPCADTLRNQGWLQSGLMYRYRDFADDAAYRTCATRTEFAGRDLLATCGLPKCKDQGIVSVRNTARLEELDRKAALLGLGPDQYRRIASDEARARLGPWFDPSRAYLSISYCPFHVAGGLVLFGGG